MRTSKFGELVFDETDLCDKIMQGHGISEVKNLVVEHDLDLAKIIGWIEDPGNMPTWTFPADSDMSVAEFDLKHQTAWFVPDEYRQLDIAEHVLSLCSTQEQLQRVGHELLMYQDRDLLDLLRYLKYLVDVLKQHNVIWGVGRGSSVASYVLYLLGVHRIDSMFYDLDPSEFLR